MTYAELYCPHTKDFCVCFQTKYATVKGIDNSWELVQDKECCDWENQQHGRNHHLKVMISNPTEGQTFAICLGHEDGTHAPAYARTKSGASKATMLIGVDSREVRQGLSWTKLTKEGPRKWIPSELVLVSTVAPNCTQVTAPGVTMDSIVALVPAGKFVIIPIRIEVLSAFKGAGDYSRYTVDVYETQGPTSTDPKIGGAVPAFTWKSPAILVEAKWLPCAPVRDTQKNEKKLTPKYGLKKRVKREDNESSDEEEVEHSSNDGGDGFAKRKVHVSGGALAAVAAGPPKHALPPKHVLMQAAQQVETTFSPQDDASVNVLDHISLGCKLLTSYLNDPSLANETPLRLAQLDLSLHELNISISQYQLRKVYRSTTPLSITAPKRKEQDVDDQDLSGEEEEEDGDDEQVEEMHNVDVNRYKNPHLHPHNYDKQTLEKENKQGFQIQPQHVILLSSPPRDKKYAPMSSEVMTAITLPGSANATSEGSAGGSFAEFDLLATAASAATTNVKPASILSSFMEK